MKLKKCVVLSDSFKGSLSSREICQIVREETEKLVPDCTVAALPMADGGEGTGACLRELLGGTTVRVTDITGPLGDRIDAEYVLLPDGTAVIEMAAAAGLPLVEGRADPVRATTFGVGQLMAHALDRGARRLVLGLGGSCTNDCGCGCAAALGARFLDAQGNGFVPVGGTLDRIAHLELSGLRERLKGVTVTAMCDVDNPMHGPSGASFVFAPQKGAGPEEVLLLDRNLCDLDRLFQRELGLSVGDTPGAGAAGAFGAGVMALLGGTLSPGVDTVLDLLHFEALISDADLVITGEGRLDSQSARGKVVGGVAARAQAAGVPVIALVGAADGYGAVPGLTAVFSINRTALPFEEARLRSAENYRSTLDDLLRVLTL